MEQKYVERFWGYTDKDGGKDACWLWTRGRSMGYGQFNYRIDGRKVAVRAHRFAWIVTHGPIPPGLCVCHRCDTPLCCNPRHFFLGTLSENQADKHAKGRGSGPPKKVSDEQVLEIRRAQEPQAEIARRYGVSVSLVSAIQLGKRRASIAP